MLTAKAETESRITGLELGADDYVPKPFEPRELVAAHRQHPQAHDPGADAGDRSRCASAISCFIWRAASSSAARRSIHLTDRERDMLRVLAAAPGETVPRMALAGNGGGANERAVDVQVNRLRRKIERDPANPLFVQTVRGIGYRLVVAP